MSVEFFDDDDRSVLVTDEELRQIIEKLRVKIKVFGGAGGGAGSNTVDRLFNDNLTGVELIAANTDARHLLRKKRTTRSYWERTSLGALAPVPTRRSASRRQGKRMRR